MQFYQLAIMSLAGAVAAVPVYDPNPSPFESTHLGPTFRILQNQASSTFSPSLPAPTPTGARGGIPNGEPSGNSANSSEQQAKFDKDYKHWLEAMQGTNEKKKEEWTDKLLKDIENLAPSGPETATVPTAGGDWNGHHPTFTPSVTPSVTPTPKPFY